MDSIDYCVEQALMGCEFDRERILDYAKNTKNRWKRSEVWMSIKDGLIKKQTFGRWKKMPDVRGRWIKWRRWYYKIVSENPHWDMDLILRCGDMPDRNSQIPKLSICSFGPESQIIAVPTWNDRRGITAARKTRMKLKNKRKQINFVGAPRQSCLYRGRIHPRVEFCNWARDYPEDIYAKITNEGKGGRNWRAGKRGLKDKTRGPMSIRKQLGYRYLLNIDGNSTAWYRLPWQMSSNSVCMNLETDINRQVGEWHYPLFEQKDIPLPFVWVTQDNIIDIKRELDRDDDRYLEQVKCGNSFVKTYLSGVAKKSYTTRLFEKINSLMK